MQEKYLKLLNNSINEITFLSILKGLPKEEIMSLFESLSPEIIQKDDYLYRIRTGDLEKEEDPWGFPPRHKNRKYGRFDKNNEILYLAQTDCFLENECLLEQDEQYFLGKYIVTKNFEVGSFLFPNNKYYKISFYLHKICQAIKDENLDIDAKEDLKDICDSDGFKIPMLYSLKVGICFGRKIYENTNWIGEQILKQNINGICYSSAYNPIDTCMGDTIIRLDEKTSNIALTKNGSDNIKFINCVKKTANGKTGLDKCIKIHKKILMENSQ